MVGLEVVGHRAKKKVLKAAEQQRPDVVEKRRWWDILVSRQPLDRLVFLDEMGVNTKLTRLYGWGPRSERVIGTVPHGHWKTSTFLGALRSTGLTAPLVIDGAMTGDIFLAYVQQQLAPTLKRGDLVILDNLRCHHVAGVRAAIEAAGCQLMYLPPYSPDWNPIELLFSKLKSLLRKHGDRTIDELWQRLGELVPRFTPDECRRYIRHCGYTAN